MSDCPSCEQPLAILEYNGVEIDYCLSCGGTWLDAGEFEMIAESAGLDPAQLAQSLAQAATRTGRTERRCPRCRKRLHRFSLGDTTKVELDRCPAGHGIWFDRGEMETVVESFHKGETGPVSRFFADLYKHEFKPTGEGD